MNILAIDNSSHLSIAIKKDSLIVEENIRGGESSSFIISIIKSLLERAGLEISQIDSFCAGLGPGSFTGLRVALATIKGFCTALEKPVVGLCSFLSVVEEFSFLNRHLAIITDAKRGMVYAGVYRKDSSGSVRERVPLKLIKIEDFLERYCQEDFVFLGESVNYRQKIKKFFPHALISGEINYPRAGYLLKLAESKIFKKEFLGIENLEPLYLHPSDWQVRGKIVQGKF